MSLLQPEQPKTPKGAGSPSSASTADMGAAKSAVARAEAAASGMLSSLRVSLMPSDLEGRPAPNVARGLIVLAVVLLVETAIIGVLYFMTSRSVNGTIARRDKMMADIQTIDKQTSALEAASIPAVSYAYQVQAAKETLGKHVYWTPFFALLEKSALPAVKFTSFSGDATTGVITVDCVAGNYLDAAQQIVSLRESPMILEVRSNSAAAKVNEKGEITGISFSMVIKVKLDAWTLLTAPSSMPDQQAAPASNAAPTEAGGQAPAFIAAPATEPAAAGTSASSTPSHGASTGTKVPSSSPFPGPSVTPPTPPPSPAKP